MPRRSLYKYFSDVKYAEMFLEGKILFRSLIYFRDYEDNKARNDNNEGECIFTPTDGLEINNLTRGTKFRLESYSFASAVKLDEIFVFCLSRSLTTRLWKEFKATVCVEITDVGGFCRRVADALPANVAFPAPHGRNQLGHQVDYYSEANSCSPRWAIPDQIAVSKRASYAWQDEFRLVFSTTDAFRFENVVPRLLHVEHKDAPNSAQHHEHLVEAKSLRDIGYLHYFASN